MILVTGGTGFLGRNMLPILLEAGYGVRVVTRTPQAYPWLKKLDVDIIQADIADKEAMYQAAKGAQYIIHAAALFKFFGKTKDFDETNIRGTHNMLEAAAAAGVEKMVHVSTIAVAGQPSNPNQIIDEHYPPQPVDDYQRTKLAGEHIVLQHIASNDVPVVIMRGAGFYGPYGRYAFNRLFFEDPLLKKIFVGVDGGRHITFPVYIKDMARGILLGLEKGTPGEIYNLCSQSMPQYQVENLISEIAGIPKFRFRPPGFVMMQVARFLTVLSNLTGREMLYVTNLAPYVFGEWNVSIQKAKDELGFAPTPFEQGVRETLQWYVESGLWKPRRGEWSQYRPQ